MDTTVAKVNMPQGRGFYIWNLAKCEGGNIAAIIDRCQRCGISWLAIKVGNEGSSWVPTFRKKPQFNKQIVDALHAAGILVFGWSYDVPTRYRTPDGMDHYHPDVLAKQAHVYQRCVEAGADGFITDSEYEWDLALLPDIEARSFGQEITAAGLGNIPCGDAPWPYTGYHQSFPFTAFGQWVDFRCPQVYWMELGPVEAVFRKYATYWDKYEAKPGRPRRPHYPSGSLYDRSGTTKSMDLNDLALLQVGKRTPVTGLARVLTAAAKAFTPAREVKASEVALFEELAKGRKCPGVLHWEWSQCPARIWAALETGDIPKW